MMSKYSHFNPIFQYLLSLGVEGPDGGLQTDWPNLLLDFLDYDVNTLECENAHCQKHAQQDNCFVETHEYETCYGGMDDVKAMGQFLLTIQKFATILDSIGLYKPETYKNASDNWYKGWLEWKKNGGNRGDPINSGSTLAIKDEFKNYFVGLHCDINKETERIQYITQFYSDGKVYGDIGYHTNTGILCKGANQYFDLTDDRMNAIAPLSYMYNPDSETISNGWVYLNQSNTCIPGQTVDVSTDKDTLITGGTWQGNSEGSCIPGPGPCILQNGFPILPKNGMSEKECLQQKSK